MAVSNLQSCCTGSRSMYSANYVIHIAEYNDQFIILTLLHYYLCFSLALLVYVNIHGHLCEDTDLAQL